MLPLSTYQPQHPLNYMRSLLGRVFGTSEGASRRGSPSPSRGSTPRPNSDHTSPSASLRVEVPQTGSNIGFANEGMPPTHPAPNITSTSKQRGINEPPGKKGSSGGGHWDLINRLAFDRINKDENGCVGPIQLKETIARYGPESIENTVTDEEIKQMEEKMVELIGTSRIRDSEQFAKLLEKLQTAVAGRR